MSLQLPQVQRIEINQPRNFRFFTTYGFGFFIRGAVTETEMIDFRLNYEKINNTTN